MQDCKVKNTLNTIRVGGYNHIENAINTSTIAYEAMHPNAIVLVSSEKWQDGYIASSLIHHPRNAPILFTSKNYMDPLTLNQIFKLNPVGFNGIKIFIIGDISYSVEEQLNILGFATKRISGNDIFELSANIAHYLEYPQNIMVISSEDYKEGLCTCSYAAHSGTAILFTERDLLPWYTREVIQITDEPNIFIVGSTNAISEKIESEIRNLDVKFVDRISGLNPYEVAINFAKYRDPENQFGWGRSYRDGHGFTFISICSPFDSPASAVFSHMGKHTPFLTIDPNYLPAVTMSYIESVRPIPPEETGPPFMHGWVIGCNNIISYEAQIQIESALSIDGSHM